MFSSADKGESAARGVSKKPYPKTIGNVNLAQRRQTLARIHGGAVAFPASRRQEFSMTYWRTSRATVTNYPNTGLKRNTTYRYRVRAFISADGFQIGFFADSASAR